MAVYTQLTRPQVGELISGYNCGDLVSFEGIVEGVENSNFKLETSADKFILTVFEKRTNEADLPFFYDFMAHLHGHGIECPFVLKDDEGNRVRKIQGKSASLFTFLKGNNLKPASITPDKCGQMGALLARMHIAAADFGQSRENSMSLPAWKGLYAEIEIADAAADLVAIMAEEIERAEKTFSLDLPKAVVHADAFPDNIFERDSRISGVIDFYFSCTDYLVYDLAITLNAWCFENGDANEEKISRFLDAYQPVRPLSDAEKGAFQDMARAASLRILMTRSFDWIFHNPQALVKPKDPYEYKRILEFHRDRKLL